MVKPFHRDVAKLRQISDHAISCIMQQLSVNDDCNMIAALKELYIYMTKYRDQVSQATNQFSDFSHFDRLPSVKFKNVSVNRTCQILDALNNDSNCIKSHSAHKLENVACTLEGEETSACWQEAQSAKPTPQQTKYHGHNHQNNTSWVDSLYLSSFGKTIYFFLPNKNKKRLFFCFWTEAEGVYGPVWMKLI